MITHVVVRFQVEGIHCWPSCSEEHHSSYLRSKHRHVFSVECAKKVSHCDRDIEFIQFKHQILQYVADTWHDQKLSMHDFGSMSCEDIAVDLLQRFKLDRCSVFEDGENGAVVEA